MACCDYTCRRCGHFWCDNGAKECPECGHTDLKECFDEDAWSPDDINDDDEESEE